MIFEKETDMNDRNAKVLLREDRYPKGANHPTLHIEYACPCGKGRIIDERVVGFGDYSVWFECKKCEKKYDFITGCGYIWELEEK